jgi:NAD(P)-dependent dehydrogenase (short-subunit alcohol dehydrogenase family)
LNDDIYELGEFPKVFSANVGFILESVSSLLTSGNLKSGSTIVIVSSVWQDYSRTRKLSYSVSKSALRGLVNSLVADLSSSKIRINAVLPGVVDSKMTRENLSEAQIKNIEMQTPSGSLVTANQVAEAIVWLTSPNSSGVNGQFITIDNGWSNVRTI